MHPYLKRFIEFAGADFADAGCDNTTDEAIGAGLRQVIEWVNNGVEHDYFEVIPDASGGIVFELTRRGAEITRELHVYDDGKTSTREFEGCKLARRT